jgi:hypothetical protein
VRRAWEAVGGSVEPEPEGGLEPLGWLIEWSEVRLKGFGLSETVDGAGLEGGAVPEREWEGRLERVVIDC